MKIAICIPTYGDTKSGFTVSLANLVLVSAGVQIEVNGKSDTVELGLLSYKSSTLIQSRNMLLKDAIGKGAQFVLWLDADHVFPPDSLLRLLAHDKPVVGVNYPRRGVPAVPSTSKVSNDGAVDLIFTTEEKAKAAIVEEVTTIGFGICLMNLAIIDSLERHAKANGQPHCWPLFNNNVRVTPTGWEIEGEDAYFFARLREVGIQPFVDHALSWQIGHLHEAALRNIDTLSQQNTWRTLSRDAT